MGAAGGSARKSLVISCSIARAALIIIMIMTTTMAEWRTLTESRGKR